MPWATTVRARGYQTVEYRKVAEAWKATRKALVWMNSIHRPARRHGASAQLHRGGRGGGALGRGRRPPAYLLLFVNDDVLPVVDDEADAGSDDDDSFK